LVRLEALTASRRKFKMNHEKPQTKLTKREMKTYFFYYVPVSTARQGGHGVSPQEQRDSISRSRATSWRSTDSSRSARRPPSAGVPSLMR
jgi:hypothetical protein